MSADDGESRFDEHSTKDDSTAKRALGRDDHALENISETDVSAAPTLARGVSGRPALGAPPLFERPRLLAAVR